MIIGALNNKEKLHSKVPEIMAYTEDLEEISKVLDEGDILFALDDNESFLIEPSEKLTLIENFH